MRTKWFFRNEPKPQFSEVPGFSPKSSWKPPKRHPNLEVLLSQLENKIFKMPFDNLKHSNPSNEEWQLIKLQQMTISLSLKGLIKDRVSLCGIE